VDIFKGYMAGGGNDPLLLFTVLIQPRQCFLYRGDSLTRAPAKMVHSIYLMGVLSDFRFRFLLGFIIKI